MTEAVAGAVGAAADDAVDPVAQPQRKSVLVRLDPAVYDALARWAADTFHSVNAQIEIILREALRQAGRTPAGMKPLRRPGRPSGG